MTLLSLSHLSRRLSGWLLVALLLATLAPAVSRALAAGAPQEGQDWVELCTARGMQWVKVSEPEAARFTSPDGKRSDALSLCGHCTLAAERFAPLLPSWPVLAAVAASWPAPSFLRQDLRSAKAICAAARGPPLLG